MQSQEPERCQTRARQWENEAPGSTGRSGALTADMGACGS
eukprot:CAMPEP_0177617454 /NCGR_PEP_ID=MMETSP0419_2-20121207/24888_1 /TAXON_ID=582737 /ORGANISM="Tetraselmis sp., Strain GSL018" /LENGTH=39 /DNA_ID= /DNA_START= /DNA_END= /DNA_ORIENTATION=